MSVGVWRGYVARYGLWVWVGVAHELGVAPCQLGCGMGMWHCVSYGFGWVWHMSWEWHHVSWGVAQVWHHVDGTCERGWDM